MTKHEKFIKQHPKTAKTLVKMYTAILKIGESKKAKQTLDRQCRGAIGYITKITKKKKRR